MYSGTWPSQQIHNLEYSFLALQELLSETSRSGSSDEIQRELSRFLVVRSCGYVEQVVEECCRTYLDSKSSPRAAAFGRSWLGRGRNPGPGPLVDLMRRFDGEWGDDLQAFFDADDGRVKREWSYLVSVRNKIAHGLGDRIGVRNALDLSEVAIEISDWIVERLDPR